MLGRAWYSERLCECHYWCSTIGLLVMFIDLTVVGVFQGFSWASLETWDRSVQISIPFWWVRIIAGLGIMTGQVCFFVNHLSHLPVASGSRAEELQASGARLAR